MTIDFFHFSHFSRRVAARGIYLLTVPALIAIGGAVFAASAPSGSTPALQPVSVVQAVPARRGPIGDVLAGYGAIGNSPEALVTLNVAYPARIIAVHAANGQHVRKGTVLVDLVADPLALLGLKQARTALDLAQGEWTGTQQDYQQHLATTSQLETARKNLSDAKAALQAQQDLHVTPAVFHLTALADGAVMQITVASGDVVAAGAPLIQLNRSGTTALTALIGIDPGDIPSLKPGNKVTVLPVAGRDGKNTVVGSVVSVGSSIDPATQMVTAVVKLPVVPGNNPGLITGQRIAVHIETGPAEHWMVPRSAVLGTGMSPGNHDGYLYQISPDNHAVKVDVHIAAENGDLYGVEGKLAANLPVISLGNASLADGAAVSLQQALSAQNQSNHPQVAQ